MSSEPTESTDPRPVVLTCAQPSGTLTLGNYLGALRNWARVLDRAESYFGIVDLHTLTGRTVPAELRRNTLSCLAQYIACGMDPGRCSLFVQSHVIGHTELAWILGCLTPIGELQRMTQFKEKAQRLGFRVAGEEEDQLRFTHEGAPAQATVNSGLLYYPVLMAADILLYNADRVPVGEDQRQHLELTRELARRFNHRYSETFTVPEADIPAETARIRSLQDPSRKMSKSDEDPQATLFLLDPPDRIRKKIGSAVTDSGTEIVHREDKPGVANLLEILAATSGERIAVWEERLAGKGYAELKRTTTEAVVAVLEPVRQRYEELMADRGYLEEVLRTGAESAQRRADRVLRKVYRKVGLYPRPRPS
jgi:tryptophanyl-tRNA synthetase